MALDSVGCDTLHRVRGSTEVPFLLQRNQVLKLPQKHRGMSVTTKDDIRTLPGWTGF